MALPLSRWTQKRLLYPVAVFAVIVPTVLMALYGTWALREIELRPASYRNDLSEVRTATTAALESFLEPLARVAPPATADDATRALSEVDAYQSNYTKAVSTRAFVGFAGQPYTVRRWTPTTSGPTPPRSWSFSDRSRRARRARSCA